VATLDGIARRGSQGVVLKAPDHPLIVAAVDRLAEAGTPVVTPHNIPAEVLSAFS
jgi:LacI family transcriptional regulator